MKLIPEYAPVEKLYLCFVEAFFHTRFRYGETLCEIIRAARSNVDIEVLIHPAEIPRFREICAERGVSLAGVAFDTDTPGRSILAEYTPIFARDADGAVTGLTFRNPLLERADELQRFSHRLLKKLGLRARGLGFPFATTHLLVNEEVALLSDYFFAGEEGTKRLASLAEMFPAHTFHLVPGLAGDVTRDLDMYLWPIAPRAWIASEYPAGTPQAISIEPALRVLREHGHTVHRVPGLEAIRYDDIDTMPNYTNGVLLNRLALVPAYQRAEDTAVQDVLRDFGYTVHPIDCSRLILSNSGVHCIVKAIPASGV